MFTISEHSYLYNCLVLFWIFLTTMLQTNCGNELHTKMMHWWISSENKLPSVTLHLFWYCRTGWIAVSLSVKLSFYTVCCTSLTCLLTRFWKPLYEFFSMFLISTVCLLTKARGTEHGMSGEGALLFMQKVFYMNLIFTYSGTYLLTEGFRDLPIMMHWSVPWISTDLESK